MNKQNKKNKAWLRNPDQIKNPKIFRAEFTQNKDGSFRMLESNVLTRRNQYTGECTRMNTRDFSRELRHKLVSE